MKNLIYNKTNLFLGLVLPLFIIFLFTISYNFVYATEETQYITSGFDVSNANGIYIYDSTCNGAMSYKRDNNSYFLFYTTDGYWKLGSVQCDGAYEHYWFGGARYDYSEGIFTCQTGECAWHGGSSVGVFDIYVFIPILGCTNSSAYNYDPLANTNDNSCITASSTAIAQYYTEKNLKWVVFGLQIIITILIIFLLGFIFNSLYSKNK